MGLNVGKPHWLKEQKLELEEKEKEERKKNRNRIEKNSRLYSLTFFLLLPSFSPQLPPKEYQKAPK